MENSLLSLAAGRGTTLGRSTAAGRGSAAGRGPGRPAPGGPAKPGAAGRPALPTPCRPGPPPGAQSAQPPARPPGDTTLQASTASPFYAWSISIADPTPYAGMGTSLALDADGRPHIAHECHPGDVLSLCYARFDGTAWQIERVDDGTETSPRGQCTSLALDAAGLPHISYRSSGRLKYARLLELPYAVFLVRVER